MLPRTTERGGFTLIELLISSTLLAVLLVGFGQSLVSLSRVANSGDVEMRLQDMGLRTLESVVDDLRRSGFVAANGVEYPFLFDGGVADTDFAVHSHPTADKTANPGDPDFGDDREIVFVLPADDDENGIPDVDVDGELVWTTVELSYVLVTGPDGVNYLQRRLDGAAPRVVARHVERVVFDDPVSSGFTVPLGAVRVRVFFRMQDDAGLTHRYQIETTIKLRNG